MVKWEQRRGRLCTSTSAPRQAINWRREGHARGHVGDPVVARFLALITTQPRNSRALSVPRYCIQSMSPWPSGTSVAERDPGSRRASLACVWTIRSLSGVRVFDRVEAVHQQVRRIVIDAEAAGVEVVQERAP